MTHYSSMKKKVSEKFLSPPRAQSSYVTCSLGDRNALSLHTTSLIPLITWALQNYSFQQVVSVSALIAYWLSCALHGGGMEWWIPWRFLGYLLRINTFQVVQTLEPESYENFLIAPKGKTQVNVRAFCRQGILNPDYALESPREL